MRSETLVMEEDNSKSDLKPQISMPEGAGQQTYEQPSRVLQLEVARQDSHLKISAHECLPGEESTIRHYERMAISMDGVETRCQEMVRNHSHPPPIFFKKLKKVRDK